MRKKNGKLIMEMPQDNSTNDELYMASSMFSRTTPEQTRVKD